MVKAIFALSYLFGLAFVSSVYYLRLAPKRNLAEQIRQLEWEYLDTAYIKPQKRVGFIERLEGEALAAGIPIKAQEFITIAVTTAIIGWVAGIWFTANIFFAAPFAAVGLIAPKTYLNYRKKQRVALFNQQLEKALTMAANSLRAGQSLLHAIEALAQTAEPLGEEFKHALDEIRLGVAPDVALSHIQDRIDSAEFRLTVTAISIHQQVGGNVIEMFETIAQTIRDRTLQKSEIKAATSDTKATGLFISTLPLVTIIGVSVFDQTYFLPFRESAAGRIAFLLCCLSIAAGLYLLRRITNIKVD